jgi:hypothetical protein
VVSDFTKSSNHPIEMKRGRPGIKNRLEPFIFLSTTCQSKATMIVRAQRLNQARRVLPFIIKRCNATVTGSEYNKNSTPSSPQESLPREDVPLPKDTRPERKRIKLEDWVKPDEPPIRKYLAGGYQIGGHLERGPKPSGNDKSGMLQWGEWGISINFRAPYVGGVDVSHV